MRSLKRDFHLQSRKVVRLLLSPDALAPGTQEEDLALRRRLAFLRQAVRKDLPLNPHVADWLTGVRDVDFPRARYAGEVSYVDQQIGRVRAELERLGLAERTILVITADHGESLGEHGVYFDHNGLYEPNLRVPLIVWAPGRISSSRRLDLVGGLDVAPTILGLAGMEIPAAMQGRDLFANDTREKPLFAESDYRRQIMIQDGQWKLIRTLVSFYYVDAFAPTSGTVELYDLSSDQGERNNVANNYPQITRDLTARLDTWNAAQTAQVPARPTVQPEAIEGLRALGYLE